MTHSRDRVLPHHDTSSNCELAQPEPAAPLDVERLGRAIVEHRTKFWANEPCVAECARDIALVYARLAASQP